MKLILFSSSYEPSGCSITCSVETHTKSILSGWVFPFSHQINIIWLSVSVLINSFGCWYVVNETCYGIIIFISSKIISCWSFSLVQWAKLQLAYLFAWWESTPNKNSNSCVKAAAIFSSNDEPDWPAAGSSDSSISLLTLLTVKRLFSSHGIHSVLLWTWTLRGWMEMVIWHSVSTSGWLWPVKCTY